MMAILLMSKWLIKTAKCKAPTRDWYCWVCFASRMSKYSVIELGMVTLLKWELVNLHVGLLGTKQGNI